MTPLHRLNIAACKSALAVFGVGALTAMGVVGLLVEQPTPAITGPKAQASPQMTLGATKTNDPPPSSPATPSATPPVKALPAPGTRPGM
jgi:hypothetical protein